MKILKLSGVILLTLLIACERDCGDLDDPLQSDSSTTSTERVTIDFEDFDTGMIVSEITTGSCDGVIGLFGTNPDFPGQNTAMIFDSSDPSASDPDLGTPNNAYGGPGISVDGPQESNQRALGKVLIISEDLNSDDPDDSYVRGSVYEFDFNGYAGGEVIMYSFLMIDLDGDTKGDGTFVRLLDKDDNILLTKEIFPGEDNAVQRVDLEETAGVSKLIIELNNSGAIDELEFSCQQESDSGN